VKEWKELPPDLLAARERLLAGIMATWKQPKPKAAAVQLPPPPTTLDELRDGIGVVITRCAVAYDKERKAELEMIATGLAMPNNYWVPRRRAEQRLKAALVMLEATT
jgi:hypothetical protein